MDQNIFEKGCIIQLSIGVWGARKKLSDEQLSKLAENHPEMVTGHKRIIDRECLKQIEQKRGEAANYIKSICLPFPIRGLQFIPKDLIETADFKLTALANEFADLRMQFVSEYPQNRKKAREILEPDGLFDELDYPMDIESKFYFEYRFIHLDLPGKKASLLSPELYKREKEKFMGMMEEARMQGVDALRTEFADMVNHIVDRFSINKDGKPKVFRDTLVTNFHDFFETFKARNIFEDPDLTALVEKAQQTLNGKNVKQIRDDENLKADIKSHMSAIAKQIDKVFEKPRRKLDL